MPMSEFDTKDSDLTEAPPRGQDIGDLEDVDTVIGRPEGGRPSRGPRRPRR
jgi:hypothetical protein